MRLMLEVAQQLETLSMVRDVGPAASRVFNRPEAHRHPPPTGATKRLRRADPPTIGKETAAPFVKKLETVTRHAPVRAGRPFTREAWREGSFTKTVPGGDSGSDEGETSQGRRWGPSSGDRWRWGLAEVGGGLAGCVASAVGPQPSAGGRLRAFGPH